MARAHIALSLASVMLAATLASAQPQPQTQPPRPQPQDPTPVPDPKPPVAKPTPKPDEPAGSGRLGGGGDVTVSGCLQRAEDTSAAGKDAGALTGGFVLKQATTAKPEASSDAQSGAQAGSKTPGSKTLGSKEYRLATSRDSVKLAEHVGHQVEVKGRVTLQNPSADRKGTDSSVSSSQPSGSTGVSTVPPATGAAAAAAPSVTLTVSSLKMVAPSCSAPAS